MRRRLLSTALGALLALVTAQALPHVQAAEARVTVQRQLKRAKRQLRRRRVDLSTVHTKRLTPKRLAAAAAALAEQGLPEDPEELRAWVRANHHELGRGSLAYWMRYELGMEVGPHHLEWSELLTEHSHLALLAARGHGKSAFWSYAYPLWRSWRDPNVQGLLISNTEDQVAKLMRIVKNGRSFVDEGGHVWNMPPASTLPALKDLIPDTWERSWTTERITFLNGSEFRAETFGTSFRGEHVTWIIVDDPLRENSQYSATERAKAKDFLFRTVTKMLLPARFAQIAVIGTPMHGDDLHAELARLSAWGARRGRLRGDWYQRPYPGHWVDKDGEHYYLWPRLRGPEWHDRERESNGLAYAQEIELRPASDEVSLFPIDLFSRREETLDANFCSQPDRADIIANGWSVYMGVDIAISAEVGADYFVIVVLAVDDNGNRWLIDMPRFKGMPYEAQLSEITAAARRYGADLIFIESNQLQIVYSQKLRVSTDLPVRPFKTGVEKHSLRKGVPSLRPLIENGKLRLPHGNAHGEEITRTLMGELNDFGFVDGKVQGIGNHDDTVMALWICDQAIRAGAEWGFIDSLAGDGLDAHMGTDSKRVAAKAVVEGEDATGVLAGMVETDRRAELARLYGENSPVSPRVNPDAVRWRHAAAIHPEGLEGAQDAGATLPGSRSEHIRAWNALSKERPNPVECDRSFGELANDWGLDLVLALLRDLLDL
jgi:hypothetical protein